MRRVLVIGASGAIGAAVAAREAAGGAQVWGTYRSNRGGVPAGVTAIHADLTERNVPALVASLTCPRGRWSAVYFCAGEPASRLDWSRLPRRGDAAGCPVTSAEWAEEAEHGLRVLRIAHELRDRVVGPIVIVGSAAARGTMPGASTYAAAHGAVDGAVRAWMAEPLRDRDHGARIRFSRPGIIRGPIWSRVGLHPADLALVLRLGTEPAVYARRLVDYARSGRSYVHAGTWDAWLTRWLPPAILEPLTAWAMGRLLARRPGGAR